MPINKKTQKIINETLATINSALSILENFPNDDTDKDLMFNYDINYLNPIGLLIKLFENTEGYNYVVNLISKFIAWSIPSVDATLKVFILDTIKEILSCSINPLITEEVIKNGVVIGVEELDLLNIFRYSPLDKNNGNFHYFGVDEIENTDDLLKCDDFNAFLWFIINKSNRRYVWKKTKNYRQDQEARSYTADKPKRKKKDGIITLEYHDDSSTLRDAYGKKIPSQSPFSKCIHVFIGDVREDSSSIKKMVEKDKEIKKIEDNIRKKNKTLSNMYAKIRDLGNEINNLNKAYINNTISKEECETLTKKYKKIINTLEKNIEKEEKERTVESNKLTKCLRELSGINKNFRINTTLGSIYPFNSNSNYYYAHPLLEFNMDYIFSMKLLDEKVVAAQLIDALAGIFPFGINLSAKEMLIRNEIKKMIQMVINNDDIVISDCFFTFSNEDYKNLERDAELRKRQEILIDKHTGKTIQVDKDKIIDSLNKINDKASKKNVENIINGMLLDISTEHINDEYHSISGVDAKINYNIIENLLNTWHYIITTQILSPKVYMLLLINLRLLGQNATTRFSLTEFIYMFKNLVIRLLEKITDLLINFLVQELMKILSKIIVKISKKLTMEQVGYLSMLVNRCYECFRLYGSNSGVDFNVDNVNYADILPDKSKPQTLDC